MKHHLILIISIMSISLSCWGEDRKDLVTDASVNPVITMPGVKIISTSSELYKGGSAAVVFSASEDYPFQVYVQNACGDRFYPMEFIKKPYYICVFGWPVTEDKSAIYIIIHNETGIETTNLLDIPLKDKKYKVLNFSLDSDFVSQKLQEINTNKSYAKAADKYDLLWKSYEDKSAINVFDTTFKPPVEY